MPCRIFGRGKCGREMKPIARLLPYIFAALPWIEYVIDYNRSLRDCVSLSLSLFLSLFLSFTLRRQPVAQPVKPNFLDIPLTSLNLCEEKSKLLRSPNPKGFETWRPPPSLWTLCTWSANSCGDVKVASHSGQALACWKVNLNNFVKERLGQQAYVGIHTGWANSYYSTWWPNPLLINWVSKFMLVNCYEKKSLKLFTLPYLLNKEAAD